MADCQGEGCDSEDYGECGIFTSFAYIMGFAVCCQFSFRWVIRRDFPMPYVAECIITIIFPLICGAVWPVLTMYWILCRAPYHVVKGFAYVRAVPARRAEKAARERQRAATAYIYGFPFEIMCRWNNRGWLVMLRCRHRIFLAQQQQQQQQQQPLQRGSEKPKLWLWKRKVQFLLRCGIRRTTRKNPLGTAGGQPSADASVVAGVADADIEQLECEEGISNAEFARAVVSTVGIAEEGLFRNIIMYL